MIQILVFINVFYAFPKISEGKFFKFKECIFLVSKTYKFKSFINITKLLHFNDYCVFHNLSLFISVKAFLPSLRVFKTSQLEEIMINMVSVTSEIKVVLILLANFY